MPDRPLKVGLFLPHWSGASDAAAPGWPDVARLATEAEAAGFDSLWVADTLLVRPDEGEPMGFWECWTLLAALAGVTERIELGSLVTGAFRNPVLLANQANTVDELSGGRLILGVGAGETGQHRHAGFDPDRRFSRLEHVLETLRGVELPLRGPRPDGPPLMLGSYPTPGPRMRRLAAQYADGWNAWLAFETSSVEVVETANAGLDAACEAVGRDPATLWRSVAVGASLGGRPVVFGSWDITQQALSGSPEQLAESLRAFADARVAHLQVYLGHAPEVEAFGRVLELLDG